MTGIFSKMFIRKREYIYIFKQLRARHKKRKKKKKIYNGLSRPTATDAPYRVMAGLASFAYYTGHYAVPRVLSPSVSSV